MAGRAGGRSQIIVVVDVALRALQRSMSARQRESSLRVIEGRASPIHRRVAHRAIGREPGGLVVRIRGRVVARHVTRRTGRRIQRVVVIDVALQAGCAYVRSRQGESRL